MNINNITLEESPLLKDCRQLISNILSEAQPDHKYILAIVAKTDHSGIIFPESDSIYPNFYGYVMDRTKMYLMSNLQITSNVPRMGHEMKIMTASELVLSEKRLNIEYISKSLPDKLFEIAQATWAWTSNTSPYQNAELILVYRDKALDFLKKYEENYENNKNISIPKFTKVETKEHKLQNSDLIEILQRRFNSFISLPDSGFFLGIADYMQYILNNSIFESTIAKIQEEKFTLTKKITDLKKQLQTDSINCANDLIQEINKQGLNFPELTNSLSEYTMVLEDKVQSTMPQEPLLHERVEDIIDVLYYKGYKEIVRKYITEDKENHIIKYNISPIYTNYLDEEKYLKERKNIALWGSWNDLVLAYAVIHNYNEEIKPENTPNLFKRMDLSYLHDDWQSLLNNKIQKIGFFNKARFVTHINRIHNFFLENIQNEHPIEMSLSTEEISTDSANKTVAPVWQDDFKWENDIFIFGIYGKRKFNSKNLKIMFKKLTEAKGKWVKVSELKGTKGKEYVRSTISQIENSLSENLKKHITIPSTKLDNLEGKPEGQGAYRIKFVP